MIPYEIRVIKIDRAAILNLIWEILAESCYEKFRLPRGGNSSRKICVDRFFDASKSEIILFAHGSTLTLSMEAAVARIGKLPIEATESLLSNPRNSVYYHTILDPSFEISRPNADMPKAHTCRLTVALEKLCTMRNSRVRPLEEHEIRVIRLSQQAIQELIWEYFMKNGDKVMDIPKKDSFSVIFHMHVEGNLEKLTLFAMNLNEASDPVFEEVEAYCNQKVGFTADLLSKAPEAGCHYVSVDWNHVIMQKRNCTQP